MQKNTRTFSQLANAGKKFSIFLVLLTGFFQACDPDDPDRVNEEEVITTLRVTLVPDDESAPVTLSFYDPDGDQGSTAPDIAVSGSLKSSTLYTGVIELINETVDPALDITDEIVEEAADHLVCYETTENLTIVYQDEDENGLPLGLVTTWQTGAAGAGSVTVVLRHQDGTKTGECPGSGETDAEVTFDLMIE